MAIRHISVKRDDSPSNVNPKFHKPDGKVIPYWSLDHNTPEAERKSYYLTPEMDIGTVLYNVKNSGTIAPGYILEKDETLYVGRVMAIETKDERIMSDVWELVTRACVYSPETEGEKLWNYGPEQIGPYKWVHVHTTGNWGTYGIAEIDCDHKIVEQWKAEEKAAREKAENERRERIAFENRSIVEKGKVVRVNRGRKVPKGTTGMVFWRGGTQYGDKLGIATTPRKGPIPGKSYEGYLDTVFVAAANVDVVGCESEEAMEAAKREWEAKG